MSLRRFKPFPAYKGSGVKWLREIPEHWEIRRLKRVFTFVNGDSLTGSDQIDGDAEVYGAPGARRGRLGSRQRGFVLGWNGAIAR